MTTDPPVCDYHGPVLRTLKRLLGRAHGGRHVARLTLTTIAKQCPTCPKENP